MMVTESRHSPYLQKEFLEIQNFLSSMKTINAEVDIVETFQMNMPMEVQQHILAL